MNKYRENFNKIRRHYLQILDDPVPIYGPSAILDNERERNRQQIEALRKKVQRLLAIMRSVPESLRLTIMKEDEKNYAPSELTHSQILKDINDLMEEITAVLSRPSATPAAEKKTPDTTSLSRKRKRDVSSAMNNVIRSMNKEKDYKLLIKSNLQFCALSFGFLFCHLSQEH